MERRLPSLLLWNLGDAFDAEPYHEEAEGYGGDYVADEFHPLSLLDHRETVVAE